MFKILFNWHWWTNKLLSQNHRYTPLLLLPSLILSNELTLELKISSLSMIYEIYAIFKVIERYSLTKGGLIIWHIFRFNFNLEIFGFCNRYLRMWQSLGKPDEAFKFPGKSFSFNQFFKISKLRSSSSETLNSFFQIFSCFSLKKSFVLHPFLWSAQSCLH
jgi:hypothetical protein